jgi:hypothetical protein
VGDTTRINIDLDEDLHYRAKMAATRRRESLRALVVRAIEAELERQEQEGPTSRPTKGTRKR